MCLSQSHSNTNFLAVCKNCEAQSELLSNNIYMAVYQLLDSGWIVYDNYETVFCSENCLDEYEIEHIDEW